MLLLSHYNGKFNYEEHPDPPGIFNAELDRLLTDEETYLMAESLCGDMTTSIHQTSKGEYLVITKSRERGAAYRYTDRSWALSQFKSCISTHILILEKEYNHGN